MLNSQRVLVYILLCLASDVRAEQQTHTGNVELLSKLVAWQEVRIVEVETDRYGRVIGGVYVQGLWVNLEMVSQGVAWIYRHDTHDTQPSEAEEKGKILPFRAVGRTNTWASMGAEIITTMMTSKKRDLNLRNVVEYRMHNVQTN
ncbi:thermonuclease family protein [Aeromonas hydrophila]|uniref:thermonuclease family protein n=1 Tax=Aeromonas hydrophila TaxID=644 RepID=UPI003D200D26